ncbi:MAG TPA: flagellar export chaperone FlgN [Armatimonadota bacterium]|jgi:hypothetical protein|nr:flagellar export chaperone FlgN [Armatimonadota bacterium]HOM71348.1 flagellar export chaperone FlgN [Armatimonadota bacterium]HPP74242.1 flagellar export chaperone FlgN [Armatimonadota bacterium]
MNNTIQSQIISIAEARLAKFEELIKLAEEQQELLINNRHDELVENLSKHDPILIEIAQLERKEQELSAQTDDNNRQNRLDETIAELSKRTTDAANRLHSLIQFNAELLMNAMSFMNFSLGLISRLINNQPSYNPNSDESGSLSLVLDSKV